MKEQLINLFYSPDAEGVKSTKKTTSTAKKKTTKTSTAKKTTSTSKKKTASKTTSSSQKRTRKTVKKELVETFSLNRQIALEKFINDGIYRLLGKNSKPPLVSRNIEELINSNPVKNVWIVYLGLFNLENIELTRSEKRIIEWAERLKSGDKPNNNTPPESILINRIQGEL